MPIFRCISLITVVLLWSVLSGCSKPQADHLDKALTLYRQNSLDEARTLLEKLVDEDRNNPEKITWLAETYRRLGRKEEAVTTARRALALEWRNSFAHTVIAEASNPVVGEWSQASSDTTWSHLMQAIECDSTDGHPWLVIFGEAIHRGQPEMMSRSLRALEASGFFARAALAYGRWMLRGLPENAILLTNGDMDTYPPCVVQEVEGFRKDVVIVNRGTLETPWYARFIRDHLSVSLPVDDAWLGSFAAYKDAQGRLVTLSDELFRKWVEEKSKGVLKRPLAVAATVDERYFAAFRDNMRPAGAFRQWERADLAKTADATAMLRSLKGEMPDSFLGPWVSDGDRSPIRRLLTRNLVHNVTETAVMCSELLLGAGRATEARGWASWAEELDSKAEAGPGFTERIVGLKTQLAKLTR